MARATCYRWGCRTAPCGPLEKGPNMATMTLTLKTPTAADAKTAAAIIADTPTSNRGAATAERTATLLTDAVRAANLAAGEAVEVTSLFPTVSDGAPLYNLLHRAVGTAPFRTGKIRTGKARGRNIWSGIKPVALVRCEQTGNRVTGETNSTARSGARLFLIAAE